MDLPVMEYMRARPSTRSPARQTRCQCRMPVFQPGTLEVPRWLLGRCCWSSGAPFYSGELIAQSTQLLSDNDAPLFREMDAI